MIKYVKKCLKDRRMIAKYFLKSPLSNFLSDKAFLSLAYRANLGKKLNLENPVTFNEKLQWLKVYDKNPEYHKLVDKYEVRKYIEEKLGSEYLIPLLGVYDSFEEIDFDALPNEFVLKPTHTSGNVFICHNKADIDMQKLEREVDGWLKRDYYSQNREWTYKGIKPRIIAEKFMSDGTKDGLTDYKFYCFNGSPEFLYVSQGLSDHATAQISFYDFDFNRLLFGRADFRRIEDEIKKPENFDVMLEIATKLSQGYAFLRVDLYTVEKNVYFSELTFYPCSGYMPFEPEEWDKRIGDMLTLPEKYNAKEA